VAKRQKHELAFVPELVRGAADIVFRIDNGPGYNRYNYDRLPNIPDLCTVHEQVTVIEYGHDRQRDICTCIHDEQERRRKIDHDRTAAKFNNRLCHQREWTYYRGTFHFMYGDKIIEHAHDSEVDEHGNLVDLSDEEIEVRDHTRYSSDQKWFDKVGHGLEIEL
jgi:hypothetical protein